MSGRRYARVRALFDAAEPLDLAERAAFLDRECAGDVELRREIEALLDTRDQVGGFLDGTAVNWAGRRIGDYEIESVIAEGGMGLVLRARQEKPRRAVALKIVRGAALDPKARQRFELEAETLGRLDHPGIAQIFEAGTFEHRGGTQPFFAMELVDGESLTRYVETRRLPLHAHLRLFIAICAAVHHAHLRGVIHRDLKPSNILVREDGQPKVLDFGVARLTDAEDRLTTIGTSSGQIIGTLAYMSPEQVRGETERVDVRSDVYALGVLIFETLTGKLPHRLEDLDLASAIRVLSEEPPGRLSRPEARFAPDLETIVEKCLRKEPERRYESAAGLAEDLQRFLRDEPIAARPPSTRYHLQKFVRRNRGAVVGSMAATAALVAGLVVSILGWSEASVERNRATAAAEEANAISGFLTEILASADPYYDGSDVKVVTVMDRAAARVDEDFSDRPEIAARVHQVLGDAYRGLGMYEATERHWRRSLDHTEQVATGIRDPRLVGPLVDLANYYLDIGDFAGADSVATLALDATGELPADSPLPFNIALVRAFVTEQSGDFEGAIAILEPNLDRAQERLAPDDEVVLDLEIALGNLYWQVGNTERALALLEPASATMERKLGADNPSAQAALNNLAMVYVKMEDYQRARPILEQILAAKQRYLGPQHPSTATGHHNLGDLLRKMGDPAAALPHHEMAIEIADAQESENDFQTALFHVGRGRCLVALGRNADALESLELAYPVLEGVFGPDHPAMPAMTAEMESLRQH